MGYTFKMTIIFCILQPVGLVTVMAQYDTTVMFKSTFTAGFFGRSIMGLGTTEHSELLSDALSNRVRH